MKRISVILSIILFIFADFSFAAGVQGNQAPEDKSREIERAFFVASSSQVRVLKIALVDCILYALKNNSEIRIKRIEPQLKADDVRVAKADFEPTFTTDFNFEDNTVLASNVLQGADVYNTMDMKLNAGVSGKVVTGGEYQLDFMNERYKSDSRYQIFNPYYQITPKITITQPLLRNFGILVNRAEIIIAQNNKRQSGKSFLDTAMSIITQAKAAYYNYIFALQSYAIDRLAWERVRDLCEIDKARYAKGLISSVALLETEAAAAEKEKALLAAEAAIKKAEDGLKLVTNLVDDPEVWNAHIELIDQPEFKIEPVDLVRSLEDAFGLRPDYQSAKIDLESREIKIKVAKNSLFPTVDLTGSFGLNGLGKDYQDALQKANSRYTDWGGGVKISIPWGGGDRAAYDQKKLEKAQALFSLKKLEQDIILEVRDRVREVSIQKRQVEVARLSKEKETQNYNAQKERFLAGQLSTHDMLDYQDKLSRAELDYAKALIDYNLALINLDKSCGLTLAKNNIKLEE